MAAEGWGTGVGDRREVSVDDLVDPERAGQGPGLVEGLGNRGGEPGILDV